ncbi:MAG: protein kinase, partial [Planctomycetota bacterium]
TGKKWHCNTCSYILEAHKGESSVFEFQAVAESETKSQTTPTLQVEKKAGIEGEWFGNYQIIEQIARGGMGIIYKARQKDLDRIVALKVLIAGEAAAQEAIDRFYLEAKSVAKMRHSNIVPVHEVGIHQGKHFFTMDFIHGQSLRNIITTEKPTLHKSLELIKKIASALHYAHEHGVVHRDIKPENVIVDEMGEPQVTDFGLAKDVELDTHLTRANVIMGTPAYMAPEQARGERDKIDRCSDIYSLGSVMYELITGQPVFEYKGHMGLNALLKLIAAEPILPRKINNRIPKDIDTICMKALEKEPSRRYQTALEFSEDIDRYLKGEPIAARPASFTYRAWKKIKKYKMVSIPVATALILLIAMAILFIRDRIETSQQETDRIKGLIDAGENYMKEGKYEEAKSSFNSARLLRDTEKVNQLIQKAQELIEEEQKSAEKRIADESAQQGYAALEEGRAMLPNKDKDKVDVKQKFLDAIARFDKALSHDRVCIKARKGKYTASIELGQIFAKEKDYGVAVFMFSYAKGLGVNDPEADELIKTAKDACEKEKNIDNLISQGQTAEANGDYDTALRCYKLAGDAEGLSDEKRKKIDDSIKNANYTKFFQEGERLRAEGNSSEAITAYERAEKYKITDESKDRLKGIKLASAVSEASRLEKEKNYKEAIKFYEEAAQYTSNPAEVNTNIAQCKKAGYDERVREGKAARSEENWEKAILLFE